MKHLRSFESISIPTLKKYLIWKSHPDSETYHIVEVSSTYNDNVIAKFLYYFNDKRNKLEKHQNLKFGKLPLEMFLPENILDQSNNLEEMKNRIGLLKNADKYNI